MGFLRSLLADLRERQVLPAVVLLVVLAIGIPIVASIALSGSSAPTPVQVQPVSGAPPTGVLPPAQEVAAAEAVPHQKSVVFKGNELSPFRAVPASKTSTPAATTAPTTTTPATTTPTTTTPTTTTPTTTTPTTSPAPKSTAPTVGPKSLSSTEAYTADIATAYGSQKAVVLDVERLTPLPENSSAEVVYLGVLKGGKRAVFLLTGEIPVNLKLSKSVTCLPSIANCQIVELKPGSTIELVPTAAHSPVKSYAIELGNLSAEHYTSAKDATKARESASAAGQAIVTASTATELANFVYDVGVGALVYTPQPAPPPSASTGPSGASSATGASGATA